ncbi:hypothetical protein Kisp02_42330 [Kineosporia sp. NBRC 101731]|nr:hypothetical protein Kisp02_42330 [Kineosporia sp. NBRC 101731]
MAPSQAPERTRAWAINTTTGSGLVVSAPPILNAYAGISFLGPSFGPPERAADR